ncbi:hypothetical protein G3480_06300 [Thiorhodococcus mannitoliphagus]|uniref:Type 2 lantipeptide synthetase LanM n=1 Tax=Thiorhodococcus mannitoliphagus TaxID=329406 RepID=A0A6P1DNV4_9GAMM|nr:lanthionine synthetase LanC family protein [Thiorhodococcus mannitoliphagus]NEX19927.1 hypothetical protein [Thiorhodococcus mannitoliphagus]
MSVYRESLHTAVDAVRLESGLAFSWLGTRSSSSLRGLPKLVDEASAHALLLRQLQQRLYLSFFCSGGVRPAQDGEHVMLPDVRKDADFVNTLSEANSGRGSWRKGHELHGSSERYAILSYKGLMLRAGEGKFRLVSSDSPRESPGVELLFPKEQLGISPGYYMAHSDTEFLCRSPAEILRLYWNLAGETSAHLMASVTERLNGLRLPFELKVMHPALDSQRCDRAVLYLHKADFGRASAELGAIYAAVAPGLRQGVPAFVKRLAPGLGLAENPEAGGSFGKHRALILAQGILAARHRDKSERLSAIEAHFEQRGIDLERPYINAGSRDEYALPSAGLATSALPPCSVARKEADFQTAESALEIAGEIALGLSREALWHRGHCTWVAPEPASTQGEDMLYTTLNATLYRGNTGVAIFLAEAAQLVDDPVLRQTSLGAMRRALRIVREDPNAKNFGLYSGVLGVAMCAARIGVLLDEPGLITEARRLVCGAKGLGDANGEFDIIGGAAGGILALIVIDALTADALSLDLATELGHWLCGTAEYTENACSWKSPTVQAQNNLTGYSHGTAGVAHALAELFVRTGERCFADIARAALEYERSWFDIDLKNWPDFRLGAGRSRSGKAAGTPRHYCSTWCHGAPGIALSRVHAYALLGDQSSKAEAVDALTTTRASVQKSLASETGSLCLCHGLLGNADILHSLAGTLEDAREINQHVAASAIRDAGRSVRKGLHNKGQADGDPGPGLMVGRAGIGYAFLRFANPGTPSLLAVNPRDFSAC